MSFFFFFLIDHCIWRLDVSTQRTLQADTGGQKLAPVLQRADLCCLLKVWFHGLGSPLRCIGIIESRQPSPTNARAARPVSIKEDVKVSQKEKNTSSAIQLITKEA